MLLSRITYISIILLSILTLHLCHIHIHNYTHSKADLFNAKEMSFEW